MAAKKYMVSYYVLYACFAVIIAVFACFFLWGYDNPVGDYNAPYCTEGLMWLMYGMFAVTAILAIWSIICGVRNAMGTKGENISGVPSGMVTTIAMAIMIVSLVVGWVCNMNETDFTAADGTVTSATMVTVSDMFIWSIYIMTIATTLATILNMSGIMKKK